MFDLGFWEVLIIGLVGLLVLGPERMARTVRMFGYWVGRARSAFHAARTEVERELQIEEFKRTGESVRRELESTRSQIEGQAREFERGARSVADEARRAARLSATERAEQDERGSARLSPEERKREP